jgi:hypothetical protein
MSSLIEAHGTTGRPLSIDVRVGIGTVRDLRKVLLDAAYSIRGNAGTVLALLFKCGFTPGRLAEELAEFQGVVRHEIADRVKVLAIDTPQQIDGVLHEYVDANQFDVLRGQIETFSVGTPTSSSREVVQLLLLRRWLRGLGPIKTADLATQSGASSPTVSAAIKAIEPDVLRTRNRQVALKSFSPESWHKWLTKSAEAQTVRFVDRSGAPRTPEKLARRLSALGRKDVAIGGVLGAMHHHPAIDITGAPRLDILIHGTYHADISFIKELDAGLVRDDSPEENARVVVHFTNRNESYFDVENGTVWADVLDCLIHMWKAGLTHQVEDLISYLRRQAPPPAL